MRANQNESGLAEALEMKSRSLSVTRDNDLSREDPESSKNVSSLIRLGRTQVVVLVAVSVLLNLAEHVFNLWTGILWIQESKIQGFLLIFFIGLSNLISSVGCYFERSIVIEGYLSGFGLTGITSLWNALMVLCSTDDHQLVKRLVRYTEMRQPQVYIHTAPAAAIQIFALVIANDIQNYILIAGLCCNIVAFSWSTMELSLIRDRFCFGIDNTSTVRDFDTNTTQLPAYIWGWRYISMGIIAGADLVLRTGSLALYFGTSSWYPWSIIFGCIGTLVFEVLVGIGSAGLDFGNSNACSLGIFAASGVFSGLYIIRYFHRQPNYQSLSALGFLLRICLSIAAVSTVYGAGDLETHWLIAMLIALAFHVPALALPWAESESIEHEHTMTQLWGILGATLSSIDVATDINAIVIFYQNKDWVWGSLLIAFIVMGNFFGTVKLIKDPEWGCLYVSTEKQDEIDEQVGEKYDVYLGRVWTYFGVCGLQSLMHGWSVFKRPRNESIVAGLAASQLYRSLFQAFPAAALQIYVMAVLQQYPFFLRLSAGFSILSVGYGITQYSSDTAKRPGYVTLYLWLTLSADFLMRTMSGAVFLAVAEFRPASIIGTAVGIAMFEFLMIFLQLGLGGGSSRIDCKEFCRSMARNSVGSILFSWIGCFSGLAHLAALTSVTHSQRIVGLFELIVRIAVALGMVQATMYTVVDRNGNPYALQKSSHFNITWLVLFVGSVITLIIGAGSVLWFGLTYKSSLVVPSLLMRVREEYQAKHLRSPYVYRQVSAGENIDEAGYTPDGVPVAEASGHPAARRLSVELVKMLKLGDKKTGNQAQFIE